MTDLPADLPEFDPTAVLREGLLPPPESEIETDGTGRVELAFEVLATGTNRMLQFPLKRGP